MVGSIRSNPDGMVFLEALEKLGRQGSTAICLLLEVGPFP